MYKMLLPALLLVNTICFSQTLNGLVQDEQGIALKGATIELFSEKDSVPRKLALSNEQGYFRFGVQPGSYRICATHIGYKRNCVSTTMVSSEAEVKVLLLRDAASLNAVTVNIRRPLIDVQADKMVINVEGTVNNIGTTAFEVLRKAPGISIDNDDNINLSGKNGVRVYIDGRVSPFSGADLSNYLSSLQSSQLDAIEIITNPSAKYEASGNAGIINIRLKKNKAFGTNGSINAGYGIGYYPKYSVGFSLNHRNKRVNIFGSYTYTNSYNYIYTRTDRYLGDSSFKGYNNRVIADCSHNIQAGIDLFLNEKSTIGFLVNSVPQKILYDNQSETNIQKSYSANPARTLLASQKDSREKKNNSININYRYGTAEKEWNIDADYARYTSMADQFQPNYYYDGNHNFLYSNVYHIVSPSEITLQSFKMNYDFDALKGKLSVGGKYGNLNSDNSISRYMVFAGAEKYDSMRSNHFSYKESISAFFVRYIKEFKTLLLQVGVRVENTNVTGNSSGYQYAGSYNSYDSTFSRKYTDLFPSASLNFKKNGNHQFSISIGRRVDRPPYSDLNPFEYKVDDYVSRRGNTALRPQYTDIIELVHIYKNKVTTMLSYSHVNDAFTQIFDTTETARTFITKTNVATQDVISLSLNYVFAWKNFSGFINANPFYNRFRSNFGKDRNLDLEACSYTLKAQCGYKLNKGWSAEVSGSYTSAGIGLGFFKGLPFGNFDIAVAKTTADNKLSFKAAMSDLFFTNKIKSTSLFAGQFMDVERCFEPRLFRISIAYKFGSSTIKAARPHKTLLDEENKRLQVSN